MKAVLPEILVLQGCEQPPQFHPEGDVFKHTRIMLELHRVDYISSHGMLDNYHYLRAKQVEFPAQTAPLIPKPLINGHDLIVLGIAQVRILASCSRLRKISNLRVP